MLPRARAATPSNWLRERSVIATKLAFNDLRLATWIATRCIGPGWCASGGPDQEQHGEHVAAKTGQDQEYPGEQAAAAFGVLLNPQIAQLLAKYPTKISELAKTNGAKTKDAYNKLRNPEELKKFGASD